jgi:ADP-ribose pyrophosphatase YjhB (NUDIX family)
MKKTRPDIQCSNCARAGHSYKRCDEPQTSYGIICYQLPKTVDDTIKLIVICRKNTIGYMEFLRGKYEVSNEEYICELMNMMTPEERTRILEVYDFEKLRGILGMTRENTTNLNEYNISQRKFNHLLENERLKPLINSSTTQWTTPEWGLPKGRKNPRETVEVCAIREFYEETGLVKKDVLFHPNMKPLEELYKGINGITYKHVYYFAKYMSLDDKLSVDPTNFTQAIEISDIKWINQGEICETIRSYHIDKLAVVKKAFQILKNKDKYFDDVGECINIM